MTIAGDTVLFPPHTKLERQPPIDRAVRDPIPGGGRRAGIDIRDWKARISVEERKRKGHFDGKDHFIHLEAARPRLISDNL